MPTANVEKPVLKALHVTMENRPGALAKVTRALADAKVNIEAIEAEILGRSGFLRFYTPNPTEAEKVLRRLGLVTVGLDVLEVVLENRPGEIARICELLSNAGVNIETVFGTKPPTHKDATLYFRVDKPAEAQKLLAAANVKARRSER